MLYSEYGVVLYKTLPSRSHPAPDQNADLCRAITEGLWQD
jgi:hypothetical protein